MYRFLCWFFGNSPLVVVSSLRATAFRFSATIQESQTERKRERCKEEFGGMDTFSNVRKLRSNPNSLYSSSSSWSKKESYFERKIQSLSLGWRQRERWMCLKLCNQTINGGGVVSGMTYCSTWPTSFWEAALLPVIRQRGEGFSSYHLLKNLLDWGHWLTWKLCRFLLARFLLHLNDTSILHSIQLSQISLSWCLLWGSRHSSQDENPWTLYSYLNKYKIKCL